MTTDQVGRLRTVLPVRALVADLVEADAAGRLVRRHGVVGHRPLIDRRDLDDVVRGARERALDQPALVDRAFVSHGLVVAAVLVERAVGRRVGLSSAVYRCGPRSPCAGSPKNDTSMRWQRRGLPRGLRRVRDDAPILRSPIRGSAAGSRSVRCRRVSSHCGSTAPKKNSLFGTIGPPTSPPESFSRVPVMLTVPLVVWTCVRYASRPSGRK